ncbi:hypothetical protein [Geoglobus ahangari]
MTLTQRTKRIRENSKLFKSFSEMVIGSIGELVKGIEISYFLDVAKKEHNIKESIFATNIDKLIRAGDEFKAIFEIKHAPKDSDVFIKYNQFRSLKLIAERLKTDCYLVVRNHRFWYVRKLDDSLRFRNNVARIELDDMELLDDYSFVDFLAEILQR